MAGCRHGTHAGHPVSYTHLGWSEWNDRYRDTVRGFWRGDPGRIGEFAERLAGSSDIFRHNGRKPTASINMITAHDGFTLCDLVSFNERHNEANLENNADGHGPVSYTHLDVYKRQAVGFDQFIPGNRSPTVNHLRLWSSRAITPFRIEAFNAGDYSAAVQEQVEAKNLSRVLYPDDSTPQGKELRLKQQYFFVSASLQDMLVRCV